MPINVNEHFKNGFRVKWIQVKSLNNSILILHLLTIFTTELIYFFVKHSKVFVRNVCRSHDFVEASNLYTKLIHLLIKYLNN